MEEAMKAKEVQERITPSNQLECIFESLPDSVIGCDGEGKILRANAAALKLFEVPSEDLCQGMDYQEFLHRYTMGDEQQRAIALEPWLMHLVVDDEAASCLQKETMLLQLPSCREVYVTMCCFPLLVCIKHAAGTFYVFHAIPSRYQKALPLRHTHHPLSSLLIPH